MTETNSRIWKISPGDRGRQWNMWRQKEVAAIGFSMEGHVGRISQYPTFESLVSFHKKLGSARPHYYSKQLWQFAHSIEEGDLLVAYKLLGILDIGIVTGPTSFEWDGLAKNRELFGYRRSIQWLGLEYTKLKDKSARTHMSRNMTLFLVSEESALVQIEVILRQAEKTSELSKRALDTLQKPPVAYDFKEPTRVTTTTYRIIRSTAKCAKVKKIYKHRCQICGNRIIAPGKGPYSEVHHIRPLGGNHNGPDEHSNMLCLCPLHHAEMDLGVFYVNPDTLDIVHSDDKSRCNRISLTVDERHDISREHLIYHKERICSDWTS